LHALFPGTRHALDGDMRSPGCIRRRLHRAIGRTTHWVDRWLATADRFVDVDPTALLGVALGLGVLVVRIAVETYKVTAKPAAHGTCSEQPHE